MKTDSEVLSVSQIVHGYRDGHQLLSSSEKFPSKTQLTLLELSDSPGSGFGTTNESCLTGYPIDEVGKYALSRTWAAPEKRRPGCVWTHTLLIDFSDLSRITELSALNYLFRKPEENNLEKFKTPIEVEMGKQQKNCNGLDYNSIEKLIYHTYADSLPSILPRHEISEEAIFALWSQQWPKLRRSFRFRTWASKNFSNKKYHFDLLLDFSNKSSDLFREGSLVESEWLDPSVEDALIPGGGKLRDFFWKYGADTKDVKKAYISLVRAWLLAQNSSEATLSSYLLNWNSHPPSLTRSIANQVSDSNKDNIADSTVNIILKDFNHIRENDLSQHAGESIGRALGKMEASFLASILANRGYHKDALLRGAIRTMPIGNAVHYLDNSPELLDIVFESREDVLKSPQFWRSEALAYKAINLLSEHNVKSAVSALIKLGNSNHADALINKFEGITIDCIVENIDDINPSSEWIELAKRHPRSILSSVKHQKYLSDRALITLSKIISPHESNPDLSEDVWVSQLKNRDDKRLSKDLAIYCLKRGLLNVAPQSQALLEMAFQPCFNLIDRHEISWKEWKPVEEIISPLVSWSSFTKKEQLCSAIASIIVKKSYTSKDILGLTKSYTILKLLTKEIFKKKESSNYIDRLYAEVVIDKDKVPLEIETVIRKFHQKKFKLPGNKK